MSMRRFLLFLVTIMMILSLSMVAAQDTTTPAESTAALQVVDSRPFTGEELALDAPVQVFFDRPLDCATASGAVTITPDTPGETTCDSADGSLTFTPSSSFARAATYTLTVSTALKGADGAALAEPFALELDTIGYLTVSDVLPADESVGIETSSVITVIFNRPVVALLTAEEQAALPSPITISPSVEGQGEWLNTSIYIFRPDPAFAGGTSYTVTVNEGLQAADGAVLEGATSWTFSTVAPAIFETIPTDLESGIALDKVIQVKFNQPMDRASVESAFYLRPEGQSVGSLPGSFTWAEDSAGFSFTANDNLALATVYLAGVDSAVARAANGDATLVGFSDWSFATVPAPAIVGTDPFDGQTDASFDSFIIYFASPMDVSSLEDKIVIEPTPWRDPDYYYSDWDNSYYINFPFEPSTTYTITILPGMLDQYGNAITGTRVLSYTTADYGPDFTLQVPGEVGFYNANADTTQLFLTHRNVSGLDFQLHSVPLEQFLRASATNNWSAASDYTPDSGSLLRQWSIEVINEPNQRRYELLQLGGAVGGAIDCPGAPVSRLKMGDQVIVISDPDPVRARSAPPDGEIIDLLYRDYQMPIVDGPVCANNLVWWGVTLRDGQTAWVAEGLPEEYFLDVLIASQTTPVVVAPTGENGDTLAPGIYHLNVSSPETTAFGYRSLKHFLVVGTANLTLKYSVDNVLIWATDVQTGAPLANAPINIFDMNYAALGSGVTDENGLLRLPIPRVNDLYVPVVATLQTATDFGIGVSGWSEGIEGWSFGQSTNYYPERYRTYIYSDRPIYRPDQPVYFRGIIRSRDDVTYTPPDMDTIPVQIFDANGEIIFDKILPLTAFGTFSDSFQLAADASLGYYRISATPPSQDEFYYSESGSLGFSVAEFRLPEFQVNLTPSADEVVQGDTIQVALNSTYFFGGVVSNADVDYSVVSNTYTFAYDGPGYYDFADFNYDGGPGEFYAFYGGEVATGTATTDSQGNLLIEVPASLEDNTQSQVFTIEAVVSDESQQVVAGRTEVVVHKGLIYVGGRPESYVSTAGDPANIEIIAVDWESQPIANQSVDVTIVERRWSSVQEEDEGGRTIWTWEVEELPVTSGSITTDASGKALYTFTPSNGGIFKATMTTRDSRGNEIISSTTMWVSSGEYVSWRQQNSNRIDLIADQEDYGVGDTAQILITSPWQGSAEALITVERGDVLLAERVSLDSNSFVYNLPIAADFAPNVYVTVMLVKGVDENNPVPAFRMGMVQLAVDNQQKEISIEITPDREQAGPRETVTYSVTTTDFQGNPVQAEVGVGLTDLASLSVAEPNSSPILGFFYGQQGLSVRTASPLTINVDQLTQTVLDTIKGGGGGGGEEGIFDIRGEFVDTAYWNAALVTGADGRGSFEVTLPDNLTTWRLDARAITSGADGKTLVGEDTFDLLSTKPLLIRPVTPRFLVVDDTVVLAAVVNNNTGADMSVEIFIEGAGVAFSGEARQTFTIPAGGRQRVEWPVTVEDVTNVDLTFFANGDNGAFTDASKPPLGQGDGRTLPVYRYEVPEVVGTAGVLREGGSRTESVVLPRRFDVTQGELNVSLEPSLAAVTIDGLDYLRNYPHQCIEQTVSRFLPNVMTYSALARLGQSDPVLESQLNAGVNFALQRLYAQQKVDGGWGWFVQDESNPLTTAYALIGLAEARNAGFVVGDDVITRAQGYLRGSFFNVGPSVERWRMNRQVFILYALARSGAPEVARTTTLFDNRLYIDTYAKAFLALTLNIINPADTSRTDVLLSDIMNNAILSATGAHWEEESRDYWNWNTDTRTTAIVLDALVKLRPDSDLVPNVVRWLMVARTADAWETTQETAWAVMSLTDWMVASGELQPAYDFSASLNGTLLAEGSASPANVRDAVDLTVQVRDLLADQANNLVIGRTDGAGVLYYTAHLKAFLPVPEVEPLNRGIIIERRYTAPGSDDPITQAQVGDLIQVRLTVIAPNDLHYAVIEDPIPAGTEGVNPNLSTEQQIGTRPGLDNSDPLSRGWGWWWFSNIEFRDEKVVLYSTYLPAGTYEYVYTIRAGLAGTYNVIPATGSEFYFPEVYGRSAGSTFTVLPAD